MIVLISVAVTVGIAATLVLAQRRRARLRRPAQELSREERQSIRAAQQAARARHGRHTGTAGSRMGENTGITGS